MLGVLHAVVKGHIDAVQTLLQINRDDRLRSGVSAGARRLAFLGGGAEGRRGDD